MSPAAALAAATLAALSLAAAAAPVPVPPPPFAAWCAVYNKSYTDPSERDYRAAIYEANLLRIKAHNARPSATWTQAANAFSDLTADEWASLTTVRGFQPDESQRRALHAAALTSPNNDAAAAAAAAAASAASAAVSITATAAITAIAATPTQLPSGWVARQWAFTAAWNEALRAPITWWRRALGDAPGGAAPPPSTSAASPSSSPPPGQTVDWVARGLVTSVKTQSSCGAW